MDDYLPPIVVEIITRARGFEQGVTAVKRDMATAAGVVEADAARMGGSVEKATGGVETRSLGFTRRVGSMFSGLGNLLAATPLGLPFQRMGSKMEEAEAKGKGLGSTMAGVGRTAALGMAAGLAVGGYEAVKLGASFQSAMTQLVTGAGEAESNIKLVSRGILDMAGTVGQTPVELAKGMYMIESAGYHGAQGLQVLKASAEGAATGNARMADVANVVTSALHDYNIGAGRSNQVTSAMIETVALGKTHLQDLSTAMGNVMPAAAALGVKFQDVTGAMSTMTVSGMSARRASMNLAFMLRAFGAPGKTAQTALESVGLTAQQLHDTLATKGLPAALNLVTTAIGTHLPKGSVEAVAALKAITGGAAGMNTALMLTGHNMGTFTANSAKIGTVLEGSGRQVQGFNLTNKDMSFQLDKAKAAIVAVATGLGEWLIPMVTKAATAIATGVQWLMRHKTVAIALAAVIAGVLAVAIGAWIASMAATVAAMSPIILVVGAVVAAGVMLATHWKAIWHWIEGAVSDAWGFIKSHAVLIAAALTILLGPLGMVLGAFLVFRNQIAAVFNWIVTAIGDAVQFITGHVHLIAVALVVLLGPIGMVLAASLEFATHWRQIWHWVSQAVSDAVNWVRTAIGDVIDWIKGHWKILAAIILAPISPILAGFILFHNQIISIMSSVVQAIVGVWNTVSGAFTTALAGIEGGISSVVVLIEGIPAGVASALSSIGSTLANAISSGASAVFQAGAGIATNLINGLGNIASAITTPVASAVSGLVGSVPGFFSGLAGTVTNALGGTGTAIVNFFGNLPGKALGAIQTLGRDIGGFFASLPGKISGAVSGVVTDITGTLAGIARGVASAVEDVGSAIWGGLKSVINSAIGLINSFIGTWDSINVNIPVVGHIGLPHIGKISYLAEGGIVTQPTLAVVGEAGPEAVIPLSRFETRTPPSSGASSAKPTSGGGGPQVELNVNMTNGPSPNEVAQEVLWRLRPYLNATA